MASTQHVRVTLSLRQATLGFVFGLDRLFERYFANNFSRSTICARRLQSRKSPNSGV